MPSAAPGPSLRRRPPGRYDEPSRIAARAVAVVLAALFVALVAAVTWALYSRYGADQVTFRLHGYTVVNDRDVRVDFDVTPPGDRTVWCLVRARDRTFAEVGHVFVPVRGTGGTSVRVRQDLTTTGAAVTGEVTGCVATPPPPGEPVSAPATPVAP